jgi:hypothetical protein
MNKTLRDRSEDTKRKHLRAARNTFPVCTILHIKQ